MIATARTVPVAPAARDTMHVVASVGDERFAFRVADVEEVIDAPTLLRVPNAPPGLAGQFAHRDRTVSAYEATWIFGIESTGPGAHVASHPATALVLRVADDRAALIVDDVEDLASIDPASLRPTPAGADPSGLLHGVCLPPSGAGARARLIGVVNVVAIVSRMSSRAAAGGGR